MIVKLMTEHHLEFLSLKEGCTGSPESTLIKNPHCWKSHAAAHIFFVLKQKKAYHLDIFILHHLVAIYQVGSNNGPCTKKGPALGS